MRSTRWMGVAGAMRGIAAVLVASPAFADEPTDSLAAALPETFTNPSVLRNVSSEPGTVEVNPSNEALNWIG